MANFYQEKEKVVKLAETDPKFRAELKKDPKAAIEKHFPHPEGKKLPKEVKIIVVEDTADTVYINLSPTTAVKSGY